MLEITAVVWSLILLSVISILLNSFCIYIIKTSTKFREKPSAVLIMNLLMTHMFQAVFVFPLYAGKKLNKDKGWKDFFSSGFLFTNMLSFYGACFAILSISLDRFLATYLLTRYRTYATFKNMKRVIAFAWIYVVLLCLVPFIPQQKHNSKSIGVSSGVANTTLVHDSLAYHKVIDRYSTENVMPLAEAINFNKLHDIVDKRIGRRSSLYRADPVGTNIPPHISTEAISNLSLLPPPQKKRRKRRKPSYLPQKEWTVFMLFLNAALPLGIIISCYVYIIYRLKRLTKLDMHNKKEKEFDKYKQVTYLTLVLSVAYTLCWSPSIIYYTILSECEHTCFPAEWDNSFAEKHIVYIIKYLSFMNAMFSPLIYCFHQQPDIQKRITKLRQCFSKLREFFSGPNGDFNNYKVAINDAKLDDITVTVQQTYSTNVNDYGEDQTSSLIETSDDATK